MDYLRSRAACSHGEDVVSCVLKVEDRNGFYFLSCDCLSLQIFDLPSKEFRDCLDLISYMSLPFIIHVLKRVYGICIFLDASSHLYNRVCRSVGPSVGPSVRPSVGWLVGHAFVKNGKIDDFDRK